MNFLWKTFEISLSIERIVFDEFIPFKKRHVFSNEDKDAQRITLEHMCLGHSNLTKEMINSDDTLIELVELKKMASFNVHGVKLKILGKAEHLELWPCYSTIIRN